MTQFEIRKFWFGKNIPSPRRGVAARSIKKPRSDLFPRRRARSASAIARSRNSGQFGAIFSSAGLTTPSAPYKDASQHFIDVASTPPLRGGECSPARIGKLKLSHYPIRSEEHTSELQSRVDLVCSLLIEK